MHVVLTVPRKAAVRPAAALGVIKRIMNDHGVPSRCLDINLDYWSAFQSETDPVTWNEIDEFLFIKNKVLGAQAADCLNQFINRWIDRIDELDPRRLLISVFSWQAQRFTEEFLRRWRQRNGCEVIIGGQGLIREENGSWADRPTFAHYLKEQGLIDHWIRGEAETTLPAILQDRYDVPGIDTDFFAARSNIQEHPPMDFGDFDIRTYKSGIDSGVLPVESSRGCIRRCLFCDIPTMHGGYRSKTGQQLANELIHYYETYGVKYFFFHDALCNGSMRDFREFNQTLVDYYARQSLPDRTLTYSSHAIVRRSSAMRPKDFEIMARAGAETMVLGVESGSDQVLASMRKDFTQADLDYNMDHYSRNGILVYFLMITGWPTETEQDHRASLDMLTRYQKYVADGTIIGVNLGTTLTIEQGTPMYEQPHLVNVVGIDGRPASGPDWICTTNPELTYKRRIMRRIEIQEHCDRLGYTFWKGDDQLKIMMDKYQERLARIQEMLH
jgi:hypothetical protein